MKKSLATLAVLTVMAGTTVAAAPTAEAADHTRNNYRISTSLWDNHAVGTNRRGYGRHYVDAYCMDGTYSRGPVREHYQTSTASCLWNGGVSTMRGRLANGTVLVSMVVKYNW